jgi:hypothetical protein
MMRMSAPANTAEEGGGEFAVPVANQETELSGAVAEDVVGAENPVTSCDLHVLVYEAAEAISSQWPNGRSGARGSATGGRVLIQRSVRAVRVVMREVLAQHGGEVARSGDQKVVEAFAAQGGDEAFRDGVRPGCLDRGADDPDVGAGNTASKAAVNVASQSRIKNRTGWRGRRGP